MEIGGDYLRQSSAKLPILITPILVSYGRVHCGVPHGAWRLQLAYLSVAGNIGPLQR